MALIGVVGLTVLAIFAYLTADLAAEKIETETTRSFIKRVYAVAVLYEAGALTAAGHLLVGIA
jgi:hypothetical protein